MDYENEIERQLDEIKDLDGDCSVFVRRAKSGKTVVDYQSDLMLPLASAAKLVIASMAVDAVKRGEVTWDTIVPNVEFDKNEDSHILYPHLQGITELELRDVVEVMIACHDQNLAQAVVSLFGGWFSIQSRIARRYLDIRVHRNPQDIEKNAGRLDVLMQIVRDAVLGYRKNPALWRPMIAGMVRHRDKPQGITSYHVANMTGGLPNVTIDIGILGNINDDNALIYAVAGKNLPDRSFYQSADETLAEMVRLMYDLVETSNTQRLG